jgi:hypothetical protein
METAWMRSPAFGRCMSRCRAALRPARRWWGAASPGDMARETGFGDGRRPPPKLPPTAQRAIHHTHPQGAVQPASGLDCSVLHDCILCDPAPVSPSGQRGTE